MLDTTLTHATTTAKTQIISSPLCLALNIAFGFTHTNCAARALAYRALVCLYPENPDELAAELRLYNGGAADAVAKLSIASGHFDENTVDVVIGTLASIILDPSVTDHG